MKRFLTLSVALILALGVSTAFGCGKSGKKNRKRPSQVVEQEEFSADLKYELNQDGQSYSVAGIGSFTGDKLIIPKTYDNLPVTAVKDEAFFVCATIKKAILSGNLTAIGECAFAGCERLDEVVIGDSVENLSPYAFDSCSALVRITLGNSLLSIGDFAFQGCKKLVEIYNKSDLQLTLGEKNDFGGICLNAKNVYSDDLGAQKTQFDENGFITYREEQEVIFMGYNSTEPFILLPDDVTEIFEYALYYNVYVSSVVIPQSVTKIGKLSLFSPTIVEICNKSDCDEQEFLSSYVGDGDKQYAKDVYTQEYQSKLYKDDDGSVLYGDGEEILLVRYNGRESVLTLPENITKINASAFSANTTVTEITFPDTVTDIGYGAFYACKTLKSITISGATKIQAWAFGYCESLESAILSDSVTEIGHDAFDYCISLKNVYYQGEISDWCAITFGNNFANPLYAGAKLFVNENLVTTLETQEQLTDIKEYVFYGYTYLESVVIGENVTSIGKSAFYGCNSLLSATFVNPNGWTYGEQTISSGELLSTSIAARHLREMYCDNSWERN